MTANVLKAPDVVVIGANDEIERENVRSVAKDAFERGQAHATQALEHEVRSLSEAISRVAETGSRDVSASSRLDADVMVSLASDLAAWFLGDLVEVDPALLMRSVQGALAKMADEVDLVLSVHPLMAEALAGDDSLGVNTIRADASLAVADFRLVADGTTLERRWSDVLAQIRPELVASVRATDD